VEQWGTNLPHRSPVKDLHPRLAPSEEEQRLVAAALCNRQKYSNHPRLSLTSLTFTAASGTCVQGHDGYIHFAKTYTRT
jgi:hypothetical protein